MARPSRDPLADSVNPRYLPGRGAPGRFRRSHSFHGTRDAVRAERLSSALTRARDETDLTIDVLLGWQAVVLGTPTVGLRTGTAYAQGGRESYALEPDTWSRFEACLAEATDPLIPLPSRAARLYLDVAFIHPFPDGNARAAMLCLAFVLHRDQARLDLVTPALQVTRTAGDLPGPLALIRLIEMLNAFSASRAAAVKLSH